MTVEVNIIILDLEWNAAYSRKLKGYINEIIEFGAVKCDENLNVISTFSSFVKLQVGKKISSVVSELTSIRDENLSDAMQFTQVVSQFRKWAGGDMILTWGTSDILTLIENCRYFTGSGSIPFLTYYADLQKYVESLIRSDSREQLGLGTAAEMLGIDTKGIEQHRALDDSLLSLQILRKLWRGHPLDPFIEDGKTEEFYKKMTFKTAIICDMSHPLVTKKVLGFLCEKCGGETTRLSKWQIRNRRFVADFRCVNCGYSFSGRVQLKEKYEGLVVNKKSVSLPKIQKPRAAVEATVGKMELRIKSGVGLLTFCAWEGYGDVSHAFSTRIGGVSEGQFASMNLGLGRGDSDARVFENYERIARAMEADKAYFVAGAQDHGTGIRRVGAENGGTGIFKPKDMESVDGLCTNEPGVSLVIYAADCVPLYFYDPVQGAIGLAHAGWRGTAAGMAKVMAERLAAEFSSRPEDILVAIGPSIGKEAFEVDPPCAEEFLKLPESEFFTEYTGGEKYHVDLWECNRRYLLRAGIRAENITVGEVCSVTNSDLIFSHRVTMGKRGSNAAFLRLI